MSGEYDSEVRRFQDLTKSSEENYGSSSELNGAFYSTLQTHQEQYGGGACKANRHHPVEGPATLLLSGIEGGDPSSGEVSTTTVTLDEGDTATIGVGDKRFRIKFRGLFRSRPDASNINHSHGAAFGLDIWVNDKEQWMSIFDFQAFNEEFEYKWEGDVVRLVIDEALGRNPEMDFVQLVSEGLSPAEALDYWMVEVRGRSQAEWAKERGKTPQAVSKNVNNAKKTR
ncbi:hypothetical protein [Haloarcula nitratireducens]|uniref:Uncharacterized protein n=1 Tax=Haloarcula nitratireducens TaxID=2487749 RepID=A0AAW4PFI1_9EURY|nr:hypothetical protein [Halomicroarcula nitratireducens]MBX0296674.1 hypothetical protein [Halomicroarcula nitratireducens]